MLPSQEVFLFLRNMNYVSMKRLSECLVSAHQCGSMEVCVIPACRSSVCQLKRGLAQGFLFFEIKCRTNRLSYPWLNNLFHLTFPQDTRQQGEIIHLLQKYSKFRERLERNFILIHNVQ